MTSMQDSPGFWLSEEEKKEEKRKMRNNYQKMENIRTVDIVNLVNELNTQKTELWSLYNNKISAFEDMDDEYRTKANKLYKKYTNTVEYVKEKGKWLAWDIPVEFDKGVLSNLWNTVKALSIDPITSVVKGTAADIDYLRAKITGAEDSWGEQYIEDQIEQSKALFKDPFLIVEGMAQGTSDTVENKGMAYAGGYVMTEVAKAVLLKKIAAGEISLGAGSKGAGLVDEVAGEFGKYSTAIDDKVTVVDKFELPNSLAETFTDSEYRTVITNEDIKLYRTFGGKADAGGGFATTNPAKSRIDAKIDTALLPEWGNTRAYEVEITIPKGQTLSIGKVAPQTIKGPGTILNGGADQILLPKDWPLEWIINIRNVSF